MADINTTIDELFTSTQTPEFKALNPNQQSLQVRQMLAQNEQFGGLGPADQAFIVSGALEALQAGPAQKGFGEFVQEVGMETVLPAVLGTGAAIATAPFGGGIPGGAAGTMAAGQIAEFTRPALTGEPMRPLEEQVTRRAVEGAFSVAADATMLGVGKAAKATTNFIKNRVKKSLGIGEAGELAEKVTRAQRVQQKAGQELLPFQLRGEEPGGILATLEDVALNSFGGNQVRARAVNQQISAAQAYKEELTNSYVQSLDSDTLSQFIVTAVKDRKGAALQMRKALYGQLNQATPDVRIDITDLVDDVRKFTNVEAFQKALGNAIPEAFAVAAKPKVATRLPGVPVLADPGLTKSATAIRDNIGNIANRISQLRAIARKPSTPEGVRNTATRAANELNRRALEQMPAEATPLWEAARGFAGAEADVLRNELFTSLMKQARTKPDALVNSLMSPRSGDTAIALRNALDKPIVGPGGQTVPGTNRWKEIVQPAIHNALLDLTLDKSGTMVGGKLLTQLRGMSKKQVNEVLGRGMFEAMKDLGSALEVAASKPSGTGLLTVRSVQTGAAFTLAGAAMTGAVPATTAVLGDALILMGPRIFSRLMASPTLVRTLAKNIKAPGKGMKSLLGFMARVGALQNEEDVSRLALEESLEILQSIKNTRHGSFIPPSRPSR